MSQPYTYLHEFGDDLREVAKRALESPCVVGHETSFGPLPPSPHIGIAIALIEQARGHIQLARIERGKP